MKKHLPLFCAIVTFLPSAARAELSPISLRVEQVADEKRDHFAEVQKDALRVFLTNASAQDIPVTVKYEFFGKDQRNKETAIFGKGEKPATVKAHMTETVETTSVTAKSEEKHVKGAALAGPRRAGRAGKEVAASGEKVVGYGVQVFQGGNLLAETYSEPRFKALAASGK